MPLLITHASGHPREPSVFSPADPRGLDLVVITESQPLAEDLEYLHIYSADDVLPVF